MLSHSFLPDSREDKRYPRMNHTIRVEITKATLKDHEPTSGRLQNTRILLDRIRRK